MTVSDWGSGAAPFGAPGIQQGRYGQLHAQGHVYGERVEPAHRDPAAPPNRQHSPSGNGADQAAGAGGLSGPERYAALRAQVHGQAGNQGHTHGAADDAGFGPILGARSGGGYPAPDPDTSAPKTKKAGKAGGQPARQGGAGGKGQRKARQGGGRHATAPNAAQGGAGALNVVGAVLSLALIVGLGVWGYKLALRDVTGVPVVKALEGPMRIQPEDPGGAVAAHQGLAVNDVPANGVSAGPVDQLKLAPPTAELSPEDVPAHPGTAIETTRSAENPATAPLPSNLPSNGGDINADAAVAEALGLTDIPGLDLTDLDAPAAGAVPVDVIPESVPGVTRSPRPMPRPAAFAPLPEITAPISAVDVVAAADQPAPARPAADNAQGSAVASAGAADLVLGQEIDPAAVDPSARLVQLGAFQSPDEARAGWLEIAALNPEMFRSRNWTIERRVAGGTPFYRLRALGFDGLQDARAFCAALVAAKGTCVPVVDASAGTVTN